ncbi:hypothetical protein [Amycolatopsis sp. NPDC051372]|uniref:acyl-CoA-like ligand-binding transcription factor n=1 Tax=unclassified Amycolatopsis TaxID=2618356 RepID=UPI0034125773
MVLERGERSDIGRVGKQHRRQPACGLVGRSVLATCRAAYERWSARADADLTVYLDAVMKALAAGFTDTALTTPDPSTEHA